MIQCWRSAVATNSSKFLLYIYQANLADIMKALKKVSYIKVVPSQTPEACVEYDIEDHELPTFVFLEVKLHILLPRESAIIINHNVPPGHDRDGQVGHGFILPTTKWRRSHHGKTGKPDSYRV